MNPGDFQENAPIPPETAVTSIMTAVAWLNQECDTEGCDEAHAFPALEFHAFTQAGTEVGLLIPANLAIPLLESIMKLAQTFVGAPDRGGSLNIPDHINDIEWNDQ